MDTIFYALATAGVIAEKIYHSDAAILTRALAVSDIANASHENIAERVMVFSECVMRDYDLSEFEFVTSKVLTKTEREMFWGLVAEFSRLLVMDSGPRILAHFVFLYGELSRAVESRNKVNDLLARMKSREQNLN